MAEENIEKISLAELVELSIGSPEKGAVNFNLIKAVLHILIGRLGEKNENISIMFRGPSADVIRNLRENVGAPVQPLDMVILREERPNAEEDRTKLQTDLEEVKLEVKSLHERLNKMTDQMNDLVNNILSRFQVTPLLVDKDKRLVIIDEKMKDSLNSLWLPHESGYKTEPSLSFRVNPDGISPQLDGSLLQLDESLPQLDESSPQINEIVSSHDKHMPRNNPLAQYEKIFKNPNSPESSPKLETIWPTIDSYMPELEKPLSQNENYSTQRNDRLQPPPPFQMEKEFQQWNYITDSCNEPFKSMEKIEDKSNGCKKENNATNLNKKISDGSGNVRGTVRQTQTKVSVSDESKSSMRTRLPTSTKTRQSRDINVINKEEIIKNGAKGINKAMSRLHIQGTKEKTPITTVDQLDKISSIAVKEQIKETLGESCLKSKERTLAENILKTEKQTDAVENMHVDETPFNSGPLKTSVLQSKFKLDKKEKKEPNKISQNVFPVTAKVKLDKREKQEVATQMKSINLSSLYGRNRHCALDDPDYLNSDMFDDKGLLKPMWDTGCFQSAYVEALKKYSSSTTRTNSLAQYSNISDQDKEKHHDNEKNIDKSFMKKSSTEPVIVCVEQNIHNKTEKQTRVAEQTAGKDANAEHIGRKASDRSKLQFVVLKDHKPTPTDIQRYLFESKPTVSGAQCPMSEVPTNVRIYQAERTQVLTAMKKVESSKQDKNGQQNLNDKIDIVKDKTLNRHIKSVRFTRDSNQIILSNNDEPKKLDNGRSQGKKLMDKTSKSYSKPFTRNPVVHDISARLMAKPNIKPESGDTQAEAVPKPLIRPPGRRGPRPKRDEASGADVSIGPRDLPRALTHESISLNVMHMNPDYDDTDNTVSSPSYLQSIMGESESVVGSSTIFPQRKKYFDLDRTVSELLSHVATEEYDPFKQGTVDALNIILHILDQMLETSSAQTMPQDHEHTAALQRRIDDLESEVFKINCQLRENKHAKTKHSPQNLNREAVDAIKHLQNDMKDINARLETIDDVTDRNKLCLESLYDFVKNMDETKMDRREMEVIAADIIERSRMDEKVDVEEYRAEMNRLTDALVDASAKQDLHRKFQLLQCDVTNKIFELLPSKLEKSEYNALMEDKLRSALTQMEAKLKQMVQNQDKNASGARKRVVLKDLLCISCNNEVVMRDSCHGANMVEGAPFHAYQHKSLRLNQDAIKSANDQIVVNRYCGATVKMTAAQKLALAKRYPLGPYGDLTPPTISAISKKYLGQNQGGLCGEEMPYPDVVRRSVSK